MAIVILLGKNDEYLGYKNFEYMYAAELFIQRLEPLMLANIEQTLSLRERLLLVPEYFPFAGRVHDIELIETSTKEKKEN